MKRKLKSFFIALFCFRHEAHSKPRRYQLFVNGLSRRMAGFFRFVGYDVRIKPNGEYWFQMRDRKIEKRRQKRFIHALTKS